MVNRITKLTTAQEMVLGPFRREYFDLGTSVEPADKPRAEAAFARAYKLIGREPVPVVWVDSPMTASLLMHLLGNVDSLGDSLGDSLRASLRDSLGDSLGDSLRDSLRASLRDSLGDSLRASLGASLGASLRASLGASLRASLWDSLGDSLRDSQVTPQDTYWWGAQDLFWVAFYQFPRRHLGVNYAAGDAGRLDLMDEIGRSCMWWYPRDGMVIACERPAVIRWDQPSEPHGLPPRLHCENGPAVQFRDGWAVYVWRGTLVPPDWIERKSEMDPTLALTHPNLEQRRAAAEIIGWHRVLDQLNAREIDRDADEQIGTLVEVDIPDIGRVRFLRVQCGTGRQFALPVPPEMQTALQANAWTYGLDGPALLKLEIRT